MMLILLMSTAIISSIVFSVYAWKIAELKQINSEYYGLSYIGICAALMVVIVSAETPPSIALMVCGVTCILLALKSKLFHRELMILNELKRGIEANKAV